MKRFTLILVCLLLLMVLTGSSQAEETGSEAGQPAPAFELKDMNGETFRLADYRGKKAVYLVFWTTWCPNCVREIPHIKEIRAKFKDRLEVLAINAAINDSIPRVERYQKKHKIDYRVAFDQGSKITRQYKITGVPAQFIIDINGIIRYRGVGMPTDIEALLKKKP